MFLDIALGIFLALGLSALWGVPLQWTTFALALGATLFPDIDLIPYGIRRAFGLPVPPNHRSFTHLPALSILPVAIIFLVAGSFWGTIVGLGLFLHLLHDTIGLGWGIEWLWPYSTRRFRMFPDKGGKLRPIFLESWTEEEEQELIQYHRDDHWIRHFYLRPNLIAYIEYGALLLAGILLWRAL